MIRMILILLSVATLYSPPVHAEEKQQSEKMKNIYKLIELTGATKNSETILEKFFDSLFKSIKEARPDISDQILKIVKEEYKATMAEAIKSGELAAKIAPVWDKYYTESEIAGLLEFHSSPLGKKVTAVTPQMTVELMAAGEEWQKSLNAKIQQRIELRMLRENIPAW